MKVRAKFNCSAKKVACWRGGKPVNIVELDAISGKGNEEWSEATPSGKVEMTLTNPAVFGAFEVGQDYYVDLWPANDSNPAPTEEVKP